MDKKHFPISIRFIEPTLGLKGVPLCESSLAFVALNHMICRAHLIEEHKKRTLANLPQADRLRFSLYLVDTDQLRQTFYLDWFSDGVLPQFSPPKADKLLVLLHKALLLYVNSRVPAKPTDKAGKLALLIFADFWDMASRIGRTGDIQQIEIRMLDLEPIIIDEAVKVYAESLRGVLFQGRAKNLKGIVEAPKTRKRDLIMLRTDARLVKVYSDDAGVSRKVLDLVLKVLARYPNPLNQPGFVFHGKPRYKINDEPSRFPEFVLTDGLEKITYTLNNGEVHSLKAAAVLA